jgi:5-methylcytosine-specific restriction endonuclease McrA
VLRRARYRCEYCGVENVGLEAHHLHDCAPNEQPWHLVAACKPCHRLADHQKRTEAAEARRLYRFYRKRPEQFELF